MWRPIPLLLGGKLASEVLGFEWDPNFILLPEGDFSLISIIIKNSTMYLCYVHV